MATPLVIEFGHVPITASLRRLDSLIVRGPLPGNGCDQSAERNGLVLAYNALHEMRDRASREWYEPIEDEL